MGQVRFVKKNITILDVSVTYAQKFRRSDLMQYSGEVDFISYCASHKGIRRVS